MTRQGGIEDGVGGGGGTRCQDCGNHAKKECGYMRCRTCCKSRGFDCQTHISSTWVPAYRRRPRTTTRNTSTNQLQKLQVPNPRRLTQYPSSSAGLQLGEFPAEVNSMATFKCFKVSSMDDAIDQLAYQTSLSIGGHVFKGILYDQGPSGHGESFSRHPFQDPNPPNASGGLSSSILGTIDATTSVSASGATTSSLDPSSYPFPLNAFMTGTQIFLHPKP